jgi:GTP-sensing pleiotropic transcriptional regulator CodY
MRGKEKKMKEKQYWDLSELIEYLATVKTQTIPAKKEEKEKTDKKKAVIGFALSNITPSETMSILRSCSRYRDRDIRRKLRGRRGMDRISSSSVSRHGWER